MEFKDWHLAVLEDYGYGDTNTALINRVAHHLSKSESDVIDNNEFIEACNSCGVDPHSFTQKDLDDCYNKGHAEGYKQGTDKTLKTVYAGVVLEMLANGNSKEEAISFLRNLDNRLIVSIDAGEDIEEVFEQTGVRLMLKEDFDRVREVEE